MPGEGMGKGKKKWPRLPKLIIHRTLYHDCDTLIRKSFSGESMAKNFIAYVGNEFTIEWYFDDREKSVALGYFKELSRERQKKLVHLLYVLGDIGKIFNEEKFRHEGDQIYAIKSSPDRFFCFFFEGSKIIITNAYEKKTAKMPAKEKHKALKAREDYIKRCKEGDYYD